MLSVSVSFENIVKIGFVKVIQRPFKYISNIFIQVSNRRNQRVDLIGVRLCL